MDKVKLDFFTAFDEGIKKKRTNCAKLAELLNTKYDFNITARSLQRYRIKEMCPDFLTAKKICEALELGFTDEEIDELLEEAKKHRDYNFSDKRYLERTIHIRLDKLSDKYDDDNDIILAIRQRIADTQPLAKGNFNRYISDLIRKDLAEHVLPDAKKED